MKRRVLMGAAAAVAVVAGASVSLLRQRKAPALDLAPMWAMKFDKPEGGELVMASFKGKPLVINFWATWCAPCVREMPEIDLFAKAHAAQGVQVLGLAVDGPTPVREFLGRVKVGFPIGLAGLDGTDLVHQLGNLQGGLPFTVFISADGELRQRKMGETSQAELAGWAKAG